MKLENNKRNFRIMATKSFNNVKEAFQSNNPYNIIINNNSFAKVSDSVELDDFSVILSTKNNQNSQKFATMCDNRNNMNEKQSSSSSIITMLPNTDISLMSSSFFRTWRVKVS